MVYVFCDLQTFNSSNLLIVGGGEKKCAWTPFNGMRIVNRNFLTSSMNEEQYADHGFRSWYQLE